MGEDPVVFTPLQTLSGPRLRRPHQRDEATRSDLPACHLFGCISPSPPQINGQLAPPSVPQVTGSSEGDLGGAGQEADPGGSARCYCKWLLHPDSQSAPADPPAISLWKKFGSIPFAQPQSEVIRAI